MAQDTLIEVVRDVQEHLRRCAYLRWAEARPHASWHEAMTTGPARGRLQGWIAGDAGRSFEGRRP